VEGLIHVTSLPHDYYHFEAAHHRLVGERTRTVFRLGDEVSVRVVRVDLDERKVDFELLEHRPGKQKGKKAAKNIKKAVKKSSRGKAENKKPKKKPVNKAAKAKAAEKPAAKKKSKKPSKGVRVRKAKTTKK
jgi:ribonuclease R